MTKGYKVHTWDWNDKAQEIGINNNNYPTSGVIAQEIEKLIQRPFSKIKKQATWSLITRGYNYEFKKILSRLQALSLKNIAGPLAPGQDPSSMTRQIAGNSPFANKLATMGGLNNALSQDDMMKMSNKDLDAYNKKFKTAKGADVRLVNGPG